MMSDRDHLDPDDPLLDACLDEVLGGKAPPDLTERILARLAALPVDAAPADPQNNSHRSDLLSAPSKNGAQPGPPVSQVPPRRRDSKPAIGSATRTHRASAWRTLIAVAAGLLALVGGAGLWWFVQNPPAGQPQVAEQKAAPRHAAPPIAQRRMSEPGLQKDAEEDFASSDPLLAPRSSDPATPEDLVVHEPVVPPSSPTTPVSPPLEVQPPPVQLAALPDQEVIATINRAIREGWQEHGIQSSPPATDAEWCRRLYLRLVGRIPTVEELSAFLGDPAADKRARLVGRLLSDELYVEEFARHWSTIWTNILIGRGSTGASGLASREGLEQYLRRALLDNKPYDEIAAELIAATGTGQPGAPDYNGAANFLLANQSPHATLATSRTASVFLGQQLQCVQCHDHPWNEWDQRQFWELNAFFRQMHVERDEQTGHVRLVNRDFVGDDNDAREAGVYYEELNGLLKIAFPRFIDGTPISRSGQIAEVDRRRALAELLRSSVELSRAATNRLWAQFMGYGFSTPVDDLGPHNPASHPQLLEQLAQQFAAHDYDLRAMMRWLALSEPFGLSSKITEGNLADTPESKPPLFSRYYLRQMEPEEVYRSLRMVADADRQPVEQEQARRSFVEQFANRLSNDEGGETNAFDGGIRQNISIMTGPLMQRAVSDRHNNLFTSVVQSDLSNDAKVEHLFLAAIARRPTQREKQVIDELLAAHPDNPTLALQDVWWALLNSNEFILDH